jgi:hypothetical protein
VFKHEWAALRHVALRAGFVHAQQAEASAFDRRRQTCVATFDRAAFMRVVAINATDFAFEHRMPMGQLEFRADLEVALEAGLRRFPRIDDAAGAATGCNVLASGAVTRFATHLLGIISFGLEACMRGGSEIANNFAVTCVTGFRSDELSSGNTRRRDDRTTGRCTGKKDDGERGRCSQHPYQLLALSVDPSR